MEEYTLDFSEPAYEYPRQHTPMVFMDAGGEFHDDKNASQWLYQKHPSFPILTYSENTNWETAAVCMRVI